MCFVSCAKCGSVAGFVNPEDIRRKTVGERLVYLATQAVDDIVIKCRNPECENSK